MNKSTRGECPNCHNKASYFITITNGWKGEDGSIICPSCGYEAWFSKMHNPERFEKFKQRVLKLERKNQKKYVKKHFPNGIPENWEDLSWVKKRRIILNRDGWRCQNCGAKYFLEVHHKKSEENDDPNNLITLCHDCHRKGIHGKGLND